jgi:hypothetical protein
MPRNYVHYIVLPKDVKILDALTQVLEDDLVTGELPTLFVADIRYPNRPKQVYRLTHSPREKRKRENPIPVPNRGKGSRTKPKEPADE